MCIDTVVCVVCWITSQIYSYNVWLTVPSYMQMEKKGMKLPRVDEVRRRARAIDGAKNASLKEEDIEQVEAKWQGNSL